MPVAERERVLTPDPAERDEIGALHELMEAIAASVRAGALAQAAEAAPHAETAKLVGPDGAEVTIPASAFTALQAVIRDLALGHTVTLIPHDRELTTGEAAEILNVSRQFLVTLLDRGELPFHRTGTHRRLAVEDVLAYRDQRAVRRRENLRELTRESQDVIGGYQ